MDRILKFPPAFLVTPFLEYFPHNPKSPRLFSLSCSSSPYGSGAPLADVFLLRASSLRPTTVFLMSFCPFGFLSAAEFSNAHILDREQRLPLQKTPKAASQPFQIGLPSGIFCFASFFFPKSPSPFAHIDLLLPLPLFFFPPKDFLKALRDSRPPFFLPFAYPVTPVPAPPPLF